MEGELRIVIIGKTGVGKSASGNTILGYDAFISRSNSTSVTQSCGKAETRWDDKRITVVDTPGMLDTDKSEEFIKTEIEKCVEHSRPGPHVFLLVLQVGQFTREDKNSVEALQELIGPKANRYMIVLFTHGDDLEDTTVKEYLRGGNPDLRRVVQSCGNRFHVFENKRRNDRKQVMELMEKIEEMVAGNKGACYKDGIYLNLQSESKGDAHAKFMRIRNFSAILHRP